MLGYARGQSEHPAPAHPFPHLHRHRRASVWRRDRHPSEVRAELDGSTPWCRPSGRHWFWSLALVKVRDALNDTYSRYPFIAYGTDWLAFGHFVIALAFLWPLKDPIRYAGLFTFGMLASILVVPFAMIMGEVRQIPWGWRFIDCSFGIAGFIPLWLCRKYARQLEALSKPS